LISNFQNSITIPPFSENYDIQPEQLDHLIFGKISQLEKSQINSLIWNLQSDVVPCVWIQLEMDDRDPGRFWLKLIAGLRKVIPGMGKEILNTLIDHHSQPLLAALDKLTLEFENQQAVLVLMNINFISNQAWWQQIEKWLGHQEEKLNWIGLMQEEFSQQNATKSNLQNSIDQLADKNEWLEVLRLLISQKEFEQAGEILEERGETWLEYGFDSLELLFWLREIPGVLLNARPVLCWLGAKACHSLELPFLVNYYSNAAEHSLSSLTRFSRNPDEWFKIEINERGLTIGDLLDKINLLKH
jgi:hypothetical protein